MTKWEDMSTDELFKAMRLNERYIFIRWIVECVTVTAVVVGLWAYFKFIV